MGHGPYYHPLYHSHRRPDAAATYSYSLLRTTECLFHRSQLLSDSVALLSILHLCRYNSWGLANVQVIQTHSDVSNRWSSKTQVQAHRLLRAGPEIRVNLHLQPLWATDSLQPAKVPVKLKPLQTPYGPQSRGTEAVQGLSIGDRYRRRGRIQPTRQPIHDLAPTHHSPIHY